MTGRIVARVGPLPPVLLGLGLLSAGGLLLGVSALTSPSWAALLVGLALCGFGVSFSLPALATTVAVAAPEGSTATAGGLLNASRQVGATLAVALMGAVVQAQGAVTGGGYALLLSAAVTGSALVPLVRERRASRPR